MEIVGHLQNYEWGKLGCQSLVAQLYSSSSNLNIDSSVPYAELWMGVHNNGESLIKDDNQPLSKWIKKNAEVAGGLTCEQCLPFLFKVLSVNKALSIQCHPNKTQAIDLFRRKPSIYKDDNHKPEIAIALTQFEVMSGFRPVEEIKNYMKEVPELEMLIPKELIDNYVNEPKDEYMKQILKIWLAKKGEEMKPIIENYISRLEKEGEDVKAQYQYPIIKQLSEWYPNDVGVFMPLFLNYFTLEPGESMFIAAGIPHAYIKGECIECMACSDNVVRCGLTPKLKDVEVLLEIIDLKSYSVDQLKISKALGTPQNVMIYNPPKQEFGVTRVTIETSEKFQTYPYETCSIFLVLNGQGEFSKKNKKVNLKFGSIYFVLPKEQFLITCKEGPLMIYFAYGIK